MIGLDVGTYSIKLCRTERDGDRYHVLYALMTGNPAGSIEDPKQFSALSARLKALLREASEHEKTVALSMGGPQVTAKNFTFPALSALELAGAVRLEAEQSIFSDLSAMYTGYQVVSQGQDGNQEILYITAPRQLVDQYLQMIQGVGLLPVLMDVDNFALANCFDSFNTAARSLSTVLINLGHSQTNIAVMDGGVLRFVRNVAVGGKDITAEIARVYGIDPAAAEIIKIHPECWKEIGLNIKNILRRSMPDLLEAIYKSIEYCMNRKKLVSVDKILLTGGTSYLRGIDSFITEILGIPAEQWNPLTSPERGNVQADKGCFLGVALGLAVRGNKNA